MKRFDDANDGRTLILFWSLILVGLGCNREESVGVAEPFQIVGYQADTTDIPIHADARINVGFSIEIKEGVRYLVVIESLRMSNSEQLRFRGFDRYPLNGPISPLSGRGSKPLPMESLGIFQYSEANMVPVVEDGTFSYQASWVFEDKNGKSIAVVSSIYEITIVNKSVTVSAIELPLQENEAQR